jgi:hypothetical protein
VPETQRPGRGERGEGKKRLTEGDELDWHVIAESLGKTISEVKEGVPVTEALRWSKFLHDREWKHHSKQDWYFAQLTYHVYLLFFILGGKPTLEPKDFLIKFSDTSKAEKAEPEVERTYEEQRDEMVKRGELSRSVWLAVANMAKKGGKLKTQKPPRQATSPPVAQAPQTKDPTKKSKF